MAYVVRSRALLALVRARREEAFAAFRAEQRHDALLTAHSLPPFVRAQMMLVQVLMGDADSVESALASLDDGARDALHMRVGIAATRLAKDQPEAAAAALAPVLDQASTRWIEEPTPPVIYTRWAIQALLLGAIALDALGDSGGVSVRSKARWISQNPTV